MWVPFLYELRTLMDWIWTDTSMNLGDWIKMEDIFVRIFKLKASECFILVIRGNLTKSLHFLNQMSGLKEYNLNQIESIFRRCG